MGTREYVELLRHMEWADALTWTSALSIEGARDDERLIDLLYHLHTVQWVYLQMWRGQAVEIPQRTAFAALPAVREWARPYYAELHAHAAGLTSAQLSSELPVPWTEAIKKRYGSAEPATLGETILQVVMHSTYHRAQVATRIKELGGAPALTDFVAWVWMKRPAADWGTLA